MVRWSDPGEGPAGGKVGAEAQRWQLVPRGGATQMSREWGWHQEELVPGPGQRSSTDLGRDSREASVVSASFPRWTEMRPKSDQG